MRWIIAVAALASLVGFAIGFGVAIELNPETADRYVLSLGTLDGWFAGAGAFAAVVFALWSELKRRREDVERLSVTQSFDRIHGWSIQLVSVGKRPARVLSLKLRGSDPKVKPCLPSNCFENYPLPVTLAYAESVELSMVHSAGLHLYRMAQSLGATGSPQQLELIVVTTVREFAFPLEKSIVENIKSAHDRGQREAAAVMEKGPLENIETIR